VKQVIIFPVGKLKSTDKKKLEKEGFIPIEIDEPSKIVMLMPSSMIIKSNDLLMSALKGLNTADPNDRRIVFTKELEQRLLEKENNPNPEIHCD
jgi:hypothetical protein